MEAFVLIQIVFLLGIAAWILSIMLRGQSRERLGFEAETPPRWVPNSKLMNTSILIFCLGAALAVALRDAAPPGLDLVVTASLVVLVLEALASDFAARRRRKG